MRRVLYMLGQLSDEHIEWMISKGERQQVSPGAVLIEIGVPSPTVFIVLDGVLGIYVDEQLVARRATGEILGEMSFIDDHPPAATVKALGPSTIFTISKADLAAKLEADRDFAARFYRGLAVSLSNRLREEMGQGSVATDDDELDVAIQRFDRIVQRMKE